MRPKILAVGGPDSFLLDVSVAAGVDPAVVGWAPTAEDAQERAAGESFHAVVLSPEMAEVEALGVARSIVSAHPATAIIIARSAEPNGLIPAAMRAGVRDVVDLSRGTDDLKQALERSISWSSTLLDSTNAGAESKPTSRGTIISVFASKGGTGKTFLACNLAVALAERSKRDTALVDLDVDLGDVFSYFGREATSSIHTGLALGSEADKESLTSAASELGPGLFAFGAPNQVVSGDPVTPEMVTDFLGGLRTHFDYTVVDATADYSDVALAAFDMSDAICLVTGLDVVGIKHLAKAMETLVSIGVPGDKLRVVLNRADSKVGLDVEDVERVLNLKVDAAIPSSRLVPQSLNKGVPLYVDDPAAEVSKSIGALAEVFLGGVSHKVPDEKRSRRFFSRLATR